MHKNYQLLIFDWEGTLVDSTAYIVKGIQQVAGELKLNVPTAQSIADVIGLSLPQAYNALFPNAEHSLNEFIQCYQQLALHVTPQKDVLFPGIKELLRALHEQNYLLAIATGKSRASLNAALQELQLTHYFASTRCADETYSKPHPQMVYELLDELMIEPHQALLIGDSEFDLQLASNAGIDAIAVANGNQNLEKLLAYNPLTCLAETKALLDWLT